MSELSKRCHLENSTLTPLVDELERNLIACRQRDPDDRRVVRLHLTDYGKELEPRLRQVLIRLQAVALQGIPAHYVDIPIRVIQQMVDNLHAS